eukprot:15365623-Ditylum_brightwellii.AAC.1
MSVGGAGMGGAGKWGRDTADPAFSHATSFRSEGYGLLLVTRFLYNLQTYTNITFPCDICIYINNKGIVTHINDQIKYSHDYPSNTLEPDWDSIAQSADHLQNCSSNLTIERVKGYQDNDSLYDDLELPAQLNVDVDRLAT